MVKALGLDPGSSRTGFAWIEIRADGWPSLISGAHAENDGAEIANQLRAAAQGGHLVAVEQIVMAFRRGSQIALIEAAKAEEGIVRDARSLGANVVRLTAHDWRGELCRSKTASDEQIRIVIEGMCPVRPALKADARPHVYDAAGVAIVALARALGRRIELPPSVSQALALQQLEERARRGARKAAGLTAVAAEKRRPTRAQTKRRSEVGKRAWAGRKAGA